jgi:hypothetical protein
MTKLACLISMIYLGCGGWMNHDTGDLLVAFLLGYIIFFKQFEN